MRKIIHIDMDSFFASVEQRDFPEYHGKPLVVGHRGPRGVVAAASYEARKFGIRSAMPMSIALRRCPHLTVVPHRFEVYKEVSRSIRNIFHDYTDLVEPLSLDEAYLDVTEVKKGPPSASLIAQEIKKEIREKTSLTASAGVSYNKFLAKIASDMDKPDGFYLIKPEDAETFLEELDVGLFFGVGEKTEKKMHRLNIFKGRDLKRLSVQELVNHFGKAGKYFYHAVRGVDERQVVTSRERKSVGAERTFETDLTDMEEVKQKLESIIGIVWERSNNSQRKGKTITLKLRYADFTTITRSFTSAEGFQENELFPILSGLLPVQEIEAQGIRLLGATLSNFPEEKPVQTQQLRIDFY